MMKISCLISKLNLFTLILLLQLHLSLSSGENHYGDCKTTKCGNLLIRFPFTIPTLQQSYCGVKDFEVNCKNGILPMINISGDYYLIKNIWYDNSTFQVVNSALVDDDCYNWLKNGKNLSIPANRFEFARNQSDILLYTNCAKEVLGANKENNICGAIAVYRNNSQMKDLKRECGGEVIVMPYNDVNQSENKIVDVLKNGFSLIWSAYGCDSCIDSGGICGYDAENLQFSCYCPDRTHALYCDVFDNIGAAALIALLLIYAKRRSKGTMVNQNVEAFLKNYGSLAPKKYTYEEIKKITNDFNEIIGEGGYGTVYRGKLKDGRCAAVKKLKKLKGDGEDFINEVVSISRTNHVNIVTLYGFCFQGNKQVLVYEYLSKGSLEKFIHSATNGQRLPVETMFSIAVGIAKGLNYLHRGCNTRILHFDIKPHNILLDDNLCPKISDFGLARLCPSKESLVSMSEARGTIGYIAPEVFLRHFGGVSHKSDVYSYGMMLIDLICGRKNAFSTQAAECSSDLYFPEWIYRELEFRDDFECEIGDDKRLEKKMILVSLWCIQTYPSSRPAMNRVLEMLEGPLESLQMPPKQNISSPQKAIFDSSEIPLHSSEY
ncbi:LEAF RUST 10 DISEASE-RESISTANCE LOCUS RECEPTOR-LIKE PROTEIN KINASE-like 2.5 isoform X2 [Amaranthus tricolor]|uniref:LEAF RUST 10 DISEASE-RESISTANCE LOCUS RECEPTOR-LIKE PROTEIN KINASE-like 2.5 isoform X2 n=1 Tax=Amaranthus tricolor TaxID=29722 RepID=UPI0025859E6B|nr:LEAF RUST 10 DISEASE-RESISTANCE LOCUS RECEPTOR-LIKE PROTEIN KINASE-like 2.5 isoform X2 [Amaranthus tricolor]